MNTIYIDTNIIPQSGNLDSLEFSTLVAFAKEGGHDLVVPKLVIDEATSQRLRAIEASFSILQKAYQDARTFANIPLLGDLPNPGELAREFGRRLKSLCREIPTPLGAAEEALRRETFRIPPAREGKGARDSAIWLTIKADHESSGNEGYFISNNTKDFADPMDSSKLHAELQSEIGGVSLHLATSVWSLLEKLGSADEKFIDDAFVSANDECASAVIKAIGESILRDLVQGGSEPLLVKKNVRLYIAGPVQTQVMAVRDSRAFSIEDRRIGIAWTKWKVVIPVGVLEKSGAGMTQSIVTVPCEGTFQLWVRMDADGIATEAPHVRSLTLTS